MHKAKIIITISLVLAVVGGTFALFIPQNEGELTGWGYHAFLSYSFVFTVLYLGAALLFITSLRHFRARPKVAYSFLCAGLILMVLAQSQLGIITYLNAWASGWVDSGLIMFPYLFGGLFVFIGMRLFSRLLKLNFFWNSFRYVMPLTAVAIIVAVFLPHTPDPDGLPEAIFDTALGFMVWNAVLSTCATIVTLRVKQTITPVFTKAMAWLFIALVVHTFAAWQIAAFQLIGFQHWYNTLGFVILPFIISGLFLVRAGYEFNKASEY